MDIMTELEVFASGLTPDDYDVITIVGDGEPTLYSGLGRLIREIKSRFDKPVAVISNGSMMADPEIRSELAAADIVMLNFDAWDEESHRKINRPGRGIKFDKKIEGYRLFRKSFGGILSLEVMLMKGINDHPDILHKLASLAAEIHPDDIFINVPIRPPAEKWVHVPDQSTVEKAVSILGGKSIDFYPEKFFISAGKDLYESVVGILARHPLSKADISAVLTKIKLNSRKEPPEYLLERVIKKLESDSRIRKIEYFGRIFYRLNI